MTERRRETDAKRAALEGVSNALAAQKEARGGDEGTGGSRHPRAEAEKRERRRRKGMGRRARLKLSIPPHLENDPNYVYRWAADRPGRIEELTVYDDYDFVTDDMTAGDERNTGQGTRIERHADVDKFGNPVRHFLLRKPKAYHEEDQLQKRERIEKTMAAIRRGKTPGESGQPIHEDGSYVPERGITIAQGDFQP